MYEVHFKRFDKKKVALLKEKTRPNRASDDQSSTIPHHFFIHLSTAIRNHLCSAFKYFHRAQAQWEIKSDEIKNRIAAR